ncbi:G-protein coupled receptor Mth2-like [Leptopilina boulardi]|uniref:G-protein coupled receptor Mth2-like n=1 Tax=Leptopilina boulardi TaxID=63433 RepID=UPI0021F5F2E3|nr:G-protein coupled receptor Mth2-like [Leptopilina boulardi]
MKQIFYCTFLLILTKEALLFSKVRKCCQQEESLQHLDRDLSCINSTLLVELNNLNPNSIGLPDCQLLGKHFYLSLNKIHDNNLYISSSACLDHLYNNQTKYNSPIIVYCDQDAGDLYDSKNSLILRTPQVLSIRKCCSNGEYFDVKRKLCVSSKDEVNFKTFLNISNEVDLVVVDISAPLCEKTLVNYVIESSKIYKHQGKILAKVPWMEEPIDITRLNDVENICLDIDNSRNILVARICKDRVYCNNNSCLRKCCPEDEAFLSNTICTKYSVNNVEDEFHSALVNATNLSKSNFDTNDYGLLVGITCKHSMFALNSTEGWSVTPEGYINIELYDKFHFHDEYCLEMFYNYSDNGNEIFSFFCHDEIMNETPKEIRILEGVLQLISSFFLLITLLVYICIPSLRNLHGKTLMCHVGSLFFAYVCLSLVTLDVAKSHEAGVNEDPLIKTLCSILGNTLLFAFISSFSWLNVMCFDIWWTFKSTRLRKGTTQSRGQRKRFIIYCVYAWGLACLITSLCILVDYTDIFKYKNRPRIGVDKCWFISGLGNGELIFFTGPVSVILLVNLIFFIMTLRNYNKVKSQIKKVMLEPIDQKNRLFEADRDRLVMNVKLFIIMGITWIFEIISNYFNILFPYQLEYKILLVFDIVNCLQGVFIFILFIMKERVYNILFQKLFDKNFTSNTKNTSNNSNQKNIKNSSKTTVMTTFTMFCNVK